MGVEFETGAVNKWVGQLGQLVNLISTQGDVSALNEEWFRNPWGDADNPNISGMAYRPGQVFELVDSVLGPQADRPESALAADPSDHALCWYPIEQAGRASGIHVVISNPSADYSSAPGIVGLGLSQQFDGNDGTCININVTAPLLELSPNNGLSSLIASNTAPISAVVLAQSASGFRVDVDGTDASFDTLTVAASLAVTDGAPSFTVTVSNSGVDIATFNDASGIDNGGNAYINAVLATPGCRAWMNSHVGNTDTTIAQVFARMGLVDGATGGDLSTADMEQNFSLFGSAMAIAAHIVFNALDIFAEREDPIIAIGNGGIYMLSQPIYGGGTDYGLRFCMPNIALGKTPASGPGSSDVVTTPASAQPPTSPPTSPPAPPPLPANANVAGNSPKFTLQLGDWLSGEAAATPGLEEGADEGEDEADDIAAAPWLARAAGTVTVPQQPGLGITLIQNRSVSETPSPNFHLGLQAVSIGFDYIGSASSPLVSIAGFSLRGMELRGFVSLDIDRDNASTATWQFGCAAKVDQIATPFGSSFDSAGKSSGMGTAGDSSGKSAGNEQQPAAGTPSTTSSKTAASNPAGQSVVASGTGTGGAAASDQTAAVAPPFSCSAAYLVGGILAVQLYDENDNAAEEVWFPSQRSFGPVFLRQLGVGWNQQDYLLSFLVDGGVQVSNFKLELMDLSLGIPVTTPTEIANYELGLEGFNIDYSSRTFGLSGGFLMNDDVDPVDYSGNALLRVGRLGISAMGSYANADDGPSLFVFANLNFPLGGVGAFFVNGLSAGFGFNRSLRLPQPNEIADFPLLKGLNDPSEVGDTPEEALAALSDWVSPAQGEYWLAGGIKWTTYGLVDTNAVFSVAIGNGLEVGLTAKSIISIPETASRKFAYAELNMALVLDTGADEFIAAAVLGPGAFLFSPFFKVSGGFALQAWWGDSEHAGDFITSLGGYHPAFVVPDYYPSLDRLGFSVGFGHNLSLYGDFYFALTTSNIMVGGDLQLQYNVVGFETWFGCEADMILFWNPLYFDAHLALTAGASYTISVFGCDAGVEIHADGIFDLWSPETGGRIEIDFLFLSLPIEFGAPRDANAAVPVDWPDFQTMLPRPAAEAPASSPAKKAAAPSAMPLAKVESADSAFDDSNPDPDLVQVSITRGLQGYFDNPEGYAEGGAQAWLVRPAMFTFSTYTTVPVTELRLVGQEAPLASTDMALGILPMAATLTDSQHEICVTFNGQAMPANSWMVRVARMDMPTAVWGQADGSEHNVAPAMLPDCVTGAAAIHAVVPELSSSPPEFSIIDAFRYIHVANSDDATWLPLIQGSEPASSGVAQPSTTTIDDIRNVNSPDQVAARNTVFACLAQMGVDAASNGDLLAMAAQPDSTFRASPMRGSVAAQS